MSAATQPVTKNDTPDDLNFQAILIFLDWAILATNLRFSSMLATVFPSTIIGTEITKTYKNFN